MDPLGAPPQRKRELVRLARAVFEGSREGILVTDAHARIVAVNRAYEDITGHAEAEIIGRNPSFQKSGHQDQAFYQAMWHALLTRGSWQGEIWNRRRNGEVYAVWQTITAVRDPSGRTTHYVALLSDITPLKDAQAQLQHLAHHDALTGLFNRLMFSSSLDRSIANAQRRNSRLALLYIDLDHFKTINDTLGHAAGDHLLTAVAQRLQGSVRAQDIVARLGGDEFTVLIEDVKSREELAPLADKLLKAVREEILLDSLTLAPSASIGIALYPEDGENAEALNQAADAALYRAKQNGRNTFSFHDADATRLSVERMNLSADLPDAMRRGELSLHYQPCFSLHDGRCVGFEALLRWAHPERGLLLPGDFMACIVNRALGDGLSRWVATEACRQAKEWLDLRLAPLRISLNGTGAGISAAFLAAALRDAVDEPLMSATREGQLSFAVEIDEAALTSKELPEQALQALGEAGIPVILQNFGVGLSSLLALQQLPLSVIKLHPRFVVSLGQDSASQQIARAAVALAKGLGVKVAAQNIEAATERDALAGLGFDEGQGVALGRPMSAAAATNWLMQRRKVDHFT